MKKILIVIVAMLASNVAYSATDYKCMGDCQAQGYQYGYCQSVCSYSNTPSYGGSTDYTCMSNCQSQGYMYNYCQSACSY
jgi:hypothetical protein